MKTLRGCSLTATRVCMSVNWCIPNLKSIFLITQSEYVCGVYKTDGCHYFICHYDESISTSAEQQEHTPFFQFSVPILLYPQTILVVECYM